MHPVVGTRIHVPNDVWEGDNAVHDDHKGLFSDPESTEVNMVTQLTTGTSFMSCSVFSPGGHGDDDSPVKPSFLGTSSSLTCAQNPMAGYSDHSPITGTSNGGGNEDHQEPSMEEIEAMKQSYREFLTSVPKVCSPTICGLTYYKDSPECESDEEEELSPFRLNVLDWDKVLEQVDSDDDDATEIEIEPDGDRTEEMESKNDRKSDCIKSDLKSGSGPKSNHGRRRDTDQGTEECAKEFIFNWSIGQVALLNPADFSLTDGQIIAYKDIDESMVESLRKESDEYFSQSIILPSPEVLGATATISGCGFTSTINTDSAFVDGTTNSCSSNLIQSNQGLFNNYNSGSLTNYTQSMTNYTQANYNSLFGLVQNSRTPPSKDIRGGVNTGGGATNTGGGAYCDESCSNESLSEMSVVEMSRSFKTPVTNRGKAKEKKKLFKKENVPSNPLFVTPTGCRSPNEKIPNEKIPNEKIPNEKIPNEKTPNEKTPNVGRSNGFQGMVDLPSPFTPINSKPIESRFGAMNSGHMKWTPDRGACNNFIGGNSVSTPSLSSINDSDSASISSGHRVTFGDITNNCPNGLSPIVNRDTNVQCGGLNGQHWDIGFDGLNPVPGHFQGKVTPIKNNVRTTPSKLGQGNKQLLKTSTPTTN